MKLKATLTLALFLFIALAASAQSHEKVATVSPKTAINMADYLYAEGSYYTAALYYKDALMSDGQNRYATYWLAMTYLQARDYEKAGIWFTKFYQLKPKNDKQKKKWDKQDKVLYPKAGYYYGVALKHNENYEAAKVAFQSALSGYEGDDKEEYQQIIMNEIAGCDLALSTDFSTQKIKVKPMWAGINSAYSETSPHPVGSDVLYYASLEQNKTVFYEKDKNTPKPKLYKAQLIDGSWTKGSALPEVINDPDYIIGNGVFSEDQQRFYFTKCKLKGEDEMICQLYLSEMKGGKWQEPVKLEDEINDPKYTSTQPAVRTFEAGSEVIYFVSDREGGQGGMDIWYTIRNAKGAFSGPRNVGAPVNTVQDELTPFFDNENQLLYFSSNGHPSIGGYDVFKTDQAETMEWSKPANVGKPINSAADDLFYAPVAGEELSGYLSSNRKGTTPLESETCCDDIFSYEPFRYGIEGFVMGKDEEAGLIEGAVVKLYAFDEDGNEYLASIDSALTTEGYFFKLKPDADYRIEVNRPGFTMEEKLVTTKGIADEDTLAENLFIEKGFFPTQGFVIEAGDPDLTPINDVVLSLFEMDADGNPVLIDVKTTDPGMNFNLKKGKQYRIVAKKKGYLSNGIDINTTGFTDDDEIKDNIFLEKLEAGKAYKIQNVYYEFGSAELTEASEASLDILYDILVDNPSIIVELSAHTDGIGSEPANMKLSQLRAESCVDYLTGKGIQAERLIPKGYGESQPVAPETMNGKDYPEGREKNRRTEFKVLGELEGGSEIIQEKPEIPEGE